MLTKKNKIIEFDYLILTYTIILLFLNFSLVFSQTQESPKAKQYNDFGDLRPVCAFHNHFILFKKHLNTPPNSIPIR